MKQNENKIINLITLILRKNCKYILIRDQNNDIIYPKDDLLIIEIKQILKYYKNQDEFYNKDNNEFYKINYLEYIDNNKKYYIQLIENISKQKFFEIESKYDSNTEIYNKKTIEKKIDECISKLINFSLVICDIDNFKNFNDKYGHIIGDEVLIKVTDILKKYINNIGDIGRYGGDEFLLILENYEEDRTLKLLKKIINDINNIKINFNEKLISNISISCGIHTVKKLSNYKFNSNQDIINMRKEIFNKADKALYISKENGKNQIQIYSKQKEK